jgi:hypothetical protein
MVEKALEPVARIILDNSEHLIGLGNIQSVTPLLGKCATCLISRASCSILACSARAIAFCLASLNIASKIHSGIATTKGRATKKILFHAGSLGQATDHAKAAVYRAA